MATVPQIEPTPQVDVANLTTGIIVRERKKSLMLRAWILSGLIVSQMLTLFTTPVVYLFFDRLQWRVMRLHKVGAELEGAAAD